MFKTHTGETIEGDRLQQAREHVASWYEGYASEIRDGAISFASHVTPETIEEDAVSQEKCALDIRSGTSDNCFSIWQRMNEHITGECVALFSK